MLLNFSPSRTLIHTGSGTHWVMFFSRVSLLLPCWCCCWCCYYSRSKQKYFRSIQRANYQARGRRAWEPSFEPQKSKKGRTVFFVCFSSCRWTHFIHHLLGMNSKNNNNNNKKSLTPRRNPPRWRQRRTTLGRIIK